jgi:hypothetical protein
MDPTDGDSSSSMLTSSLSGEYLTTELLLKLTNSQTGGQLTPTSLSLIHRLTYNWLQQVKVKVTLRLTASQSVSLGVEPPSGAHDQIFFFDIYGLVFVGCPLWREDGSVFCIYCWPLPVRSFSGPSPLKLETIFYCLRLETSLFVASYDSQGHSRGIRPRLHTGIPLSHSVNILNVVLKHNSKLELTAAWLVSLLYNPLAQTA